MLIEMLYDGLLAHFQVLSESCPEEKLEQPTKQRARAILTPCVLEVIASRGRRITLGLLPNKPLAEAHSFDYGFVLELSERISFRIDSANLFLQRLRKELYEHLASGGVIGGQWGRLALNGDLILFEKGEYAEPTAALQRAIPEDSEVNDDSDEDFDQNYLAEE
jgi:hypothetical protein